ncbi:S-adenosyl-L-methionine-dependent methyltransferase [Rhizodiscina lignyota]|uniref:S-adenosyl-L-methionine-dependent methyltransferase n=1 Tax=Rhizodiscina lignyota TaxID=1504668 RepID=A0A9P4IPK6_9PEZI|nr:S-adenosyl-L-methionine-dependent methyltransferase [Rhizodiscina lignyota]
MSGTHNLRELARQIAKDVTAVDDFIVSNKLPYPSSTADTPLLFPVDPSHGDVYKARIDAIQALDSLRGLLLSPPERAMLQMQYMETAALQALRRFDVFKAVPIDGHASYSQIAEQCSIPEDRLRRFLRYAMACGFFDERDGLVSHSASSAVFLRIPLWYDMLGMVTELAFPAMPNVVNAMQKFPGSSEPNETGLNVAFGMDKTAFEWFAEDEARSVLFANAMKATMSAPGYNAEFIVKGHDWARYSDGLIVDVGGSNGHVSVQLAKQFANLKFVVQDFPSAFKDAAESVPKDLRVRVEFMAHNFFETQPIRGASVYLLRWILHDWSDPYCVKILRALVPALRNGSRILIADNTMPPRGSLPNHEEKLRSFADLMMMAFHNSKERSPEQFWALFQEADPRFKLVEFRQPEGSSLGFMEVLFENESEEP